MNKEVKDAKIILLGEVLASFFVGLLGESCGIDVTFYGHGAAEDYIYNGNRGKNEKMERIIYWR